MHYKVTCAVCGKELETYHSRTKYCSDRCRRIAWNAMEREIRQQRKLAKNCPTNTRPFLDFMREVDASGMSYGEYVAWKSKNSLKP